jgi:dehydrogenase/reductase SDR family protein 12
MHPGWVDTPALREAMPDFHKKFENSLKDEDEGADTIVYLSTMPFEEVVNGEFYYDREIADKHLTISCTGYSDKDAKKMMKRLEDLEAKKV